jgi:acyl dehydratase
MPLRIFERIADLKSHAGQEVGISDWFVITQAQINAFAEVTGDRQWIHVDADRAKTESPFGTTIAHGFLTLSLLSHLHGQAVELHGDFKMAINYGLNRVRFPSPVAAGARIRTHSTLQTVEDIPGGIQVLWLVRMEIEGHPKPALVAEWLVRFYS